MAVASLQTLAHALDRLVGCSKPWAFSIEPFLFLLHQPWKKQRGVWTQPLRPHALELMGFLLWTSVSFSLK